MFAELFKCEECGATFSFPLKCATVTCKMCGKIYGRPGGPGEQISALARANREWVACLFTDAEKTYRAVLQQDPECAEAWWGLTMCRYGVEAVEGKPTIHFLNEQPIQEDENFLRACEFAEDASEYRAVAAYIGDIQKNLQQTVVDIPEWDVFICYKGSSTKKGERYAPEYFHAYQLYLDLQKEGYQAFFAAQSLLTEIGSRFEAQIFRALYSAKVMLVVSSVPEHMEAPWPKSEWSRYLERCEKDKSCQIFPMLYDGCEPERLPAALKSLQCITVGQGDWFGTLRSNLQRAISFPKPLVKDNSAELTNALLRVEYALDKSDWEAAAELAAEVCRNYPSCAKGYMYQLLAKLRVPSVDRLRMRVKPYETEKDWEWAMKLAGETDRACWTAVLKDSLALRRQREEERRIAEERKRAEAQRRAEERRKAEEKRRQEAAARAEAQHKEAVAQAEVARLMQEKARAEAARKAEEERRLQVYWQKAEKRAKSKAGARAGIMGAATLWLYIAGMLRWVPGIPFGQDVQIGLLCMLLVGVTVFPIGGWLSSKRAAGSIGAGQGLLVSIAAAVFIGLAIQRWCRQGTSWAEIGRSFALPWAGAALLFTIAACLTKNYIFVASVPAMIWIVLLMSSYLWPEWMGFAESRGISAEIVESIVLFALPGIAALVSGCIWKKALYQEMMNHFEKKLQKGRVTQK